MREDQEYLHDAFISYSRKDKDFASLIKKALEKYLPANDTSIPHRHLDIFRDEEDFTGTEYYASINKHLQSSKKLILICSPAARESSYVNEEIRTFIKLNNINAIIPILLDGIPNNEALKEQASEMAFPEALVENMDMPLAINYCRFVMGKDKVNAGFFLNSWFSLLANIYEISRSDIEQREKKRRNRIFKIRVAIICLSFIFLLSFTLWALFERNIAVNQKFQAQLQSKIAISRYFVGQSFLYNLYQIDNALLMSMAAFRIMQTTETQDGLLRAIQLLPRRLTFLRGHERGVFHIAFSSDGKILASVSQDNSVTLWDVVTRKAIHRALAKHEQSEKYWATFSPDLNTLITGDSGCTITMWDMATNQLIGNPLKGHSSSVTNFTFSPDGKMFASRDRNGTLILWELPHCQQIGKLLTEHERAIWDFAFSPDGKNIALGYSDGTIILWNIVAHKPLGQPFPIHEGGAREVAFSPDGKLLASGGYRGNILLLDVATHEQIGRPLEMHKGAVLDLAFSPDGKTLASCDSYDSSVILWDIARRLEPKKFHGLMDAIRNAPKDTRVAMPKKSVLSIAFNPNGKTLAIGSADGYVTLCDISSNGPLSVPLRKHEGAVTSIAFSPDGRSIASGSIDETAILWDVSTHQPLAPPFIVGHQGQNRGVTVKLTFSPDGKTLTTGRGYASWTEVDGIAKIDGYNGPLGRLGAEKIDNGRGRPDTTLGTIILWDIASHKLKKILDGHNAPISSLAYSPIGNIFVSGSVDGTISFWNVTNWEQIGETINGHHNYVSGIAFSPDGKILASCSQDDTVKLWDVINHRLAGLPISADQHGVYSIAFNPNGKSFATGGHNGTVILWDIGTHQIIGQPLIGHTGVVASISYRPDGKILASGGFDRNVILWDEATQKAIGKPLSGHDDEVSSIAFSPDGKVLASGSDDKTVILWAVDPMVWEGMACQIISRNLTHKEWNYYVGEGIPYMPICPNLPIPEK